MLTALLAEAAATRTTYDFERWQSFGERWHVLALLAVCAAVLVFVASLYRRDSVELRPGLGLVLLRPAGDGAAGRVGLFSGTRKADRANGRPQLARAGAGRHQPEHGIARLRPSRFPGGTGAPPDDPSGKRRPTAARRPVGSSKSRPCSTAADSSAACARSTTSFSSASIPRSAGWQRSPNRSRRPTGSSPTAARRRTSSDALPTAPRTKRRRRSDASDWKKSLRPQGVETRLGQALRDLIHEERAAPVAGIVVFSDGGQNAGIDAQSAILSARDAKIPVFTVGVGSDRRPAGVRVADFVAPARAYPGDSFTVTGYLQAQELAGRTVAVELTSKPAGDATSIQPSKSEGTEQVLLGGNTETRSGQVHAHARRCRPPHLSAGSETPARGSQHRRQCPGGRRRDRRSKNQGLAAGQRADARIHLPAQPIATRFGNGRRRRLAVGPEGHFAGRQRNPRRISQRSTGIVRIRCDRRLRSRLAGPR